MLPSVASAFDKTMAFVLRPHLRGHISPAAEPEPDPQRGVVQAACTIREPAPRPSSSVAAEVKPPPPSPPGRTSAAAEVEPPPPSPPGRTLAAGAVAPEIGKEARAAWKRGEIGTEEACAICIGPIVAPVELPCGHAYCGACLAELRAHPGVAQVCPMCRIDLPPGVDSQLDRGHQACLSVRKISGMVSRGEVTWTSLPVALQEEMDEAVANLIEAAAQGHMQAHYYLGTVFTCGWGVVQDYGRAFELFTQAALQGHADSQYILAVMYYAGEGCEQSYERAVEWWTKAAEQGHLSARNGLGDVTRNGLGDAYLEGNGVPQNSERALELFKLSAAQGNEGAQYNVAWIERGGRASANSYAKVQRLCNHLELRSMKVGETIVRFIGGVIEKDCPLLGRRVVLRGLATSPRGREALNGAAGTAIDFTVTKRNERNTLWLMESGRYTVKLDGSHGNKIVRARVEEVVEEEATLASTSVQRKLFTAAAGVTIVALMAPPIRNPLLRILSIVATPLLYPRRWKICL